MHEYGNIRLVNTVPAIQEGRCLQQVKAFLPTSVGDVIVHYIYALLLGLLPEPFANGRDDRTYLVGYFDCFYLVLPMEVLLLCYQTFLINRWHVIRLLAHHLEEGGLALYAVRHHTHQESVPQGFQSFILGW